MYEIKFVYDDMTEWVYGRGGGHTDKLKLIMTKGEYLKRVTHERFLNYSSAGAAVEFETNKGRIFSYEPVTFTTKHRCERDTIVAEEGHEILALKIRRGMLVGSVQQVGDR